MSLFIFARAGLSLAVVAWIVVQQYHYVFRNNNVTVGVQRLGYAISVQEYDIAVELNAASLTPEGRTWLRWAFEEDSDSWTKVAYTWRILGVVLTDGIGKPPMVDWSLSFRHWIVVAFFLTFYVVLRWVYRQREEVAADD